VVAQNASRAMEDLFDPFHEIAELLKSIQLIKKAEDARW
jgi:hypothetical protein